ncbi:unnamed protein product [Polarella glacialis]|uniref:EF-hand domain-containing protein n=1 Tax=Polarella glacialis TaxID=89957 RepID=A0A813LL77_POLGL|nr:unnamed protein product [Polarella glacialis]
MKLCRQFRWLSELRKLMMMMASCLRTLFWSFLFCFIVMSAWSMAAVELINPLVQQMAAEGVFDSCRTCRSSLTSVMRANLMMFQTIIAGDSWGQLAVPVIEAHPWTAIIFIGSLLTLVFGVLNMIVAVVVDTFAEHRQRDVMNLAEEMDSDAAEDRRFLQKIFDQIDEDGSGELSLEELMSGARTVPEFQGRLRVMDIDENDLVQMFEMIDGDGSGSVDPEEFINTLNRWANDSKTAARFVKYQMMRSIAEQEELKSLVVSKLESLEKSLKKPSQKRRKDGKRPTPGPLDVLVEVEGDESTSTSHFRPQESQDSFMVSVDEDVEEFHVGGSGELAEDKKVEGSESEALPTLAGAGRRYSSFLGRRQQATASTLELETEQSLKTAIAAAALVLKESLMAAAEEAMTESLLAAELTLKKAMPKSSGSSSSGSFEKMSLRQSVAALAVGCRSGRAAPLIRAVPPLLGPRGHQATFRVRANSGCSAPPSPPSSCCVAGLCVQEHPSLDEHLSLDGPEHPPAGNGSFIAEQL